ncbi:MAG: Rpn family recombination-promoting nuclease/putative transposase [Lachnospiraceae bacterium]|nr:Rpn family recombination-promoting nuclease/putative transposase [Lachnospiraceae bacterium]
MTHYTQKNYKDTFFNFLFGREERKEYLLSLYNALNNKDYTNLDDLTINTIENVIYMGYKNDVSCIVASDEIMSLYEHQSSYNPNMPIRGVIYFSQLYKKYIKTNKLNLYGSKMIKLPTPQYYVFYVGHDDVPEKQVLKLSDMFAQQTDVLECRATMLNINSDNNRELIEKCKPLRDYSYFINSVYEYKKIYATIEEAIDKTVGRCIEENVLADILLAHKAEVTEMLLTEFDDKEYIDMVKAESKAEGKAEGLVEGKAIGERNMILKMISDGTITPEQGARELNISIDELYS